MRRDKNGPDLRDLSIRVLVLEALLRAVMRERLNDLPEAKRRQAPNDWFSAAMSELDRETGERSTLSPAASSGEFDDQATLLLSDLYEPASRAVAQRKLRPRS